MHHRLTNKSNLLILLLFFFFCNSFAQPVQLNLKKEFPIIKIENDVWFGVPGGIYQFKTNDDSYKLFIIPGKENSQVKYMYYNNEWLWCVLDSGIAALQIRLNQWMVFDKNNGLPSNNIRSVAFQTDYVWIASDNGAARFDLLIEEWESYDLSKGLPDLDLIKVLTKNEMVWFVTTNGLFEYNPQFEKWRKFPLPVDDSIQLTEAFMIGEDIWTTSQKGLIKFNLQLTSYQYFFNENINIENLNEVIYEENAIWMLSKSGLYNISTESLVIKEFEGNFFLKDYELIQFGIDAGEIWFVTNKNALSYNRSNKTWKITDYASGISDTTYRNIYESGGMTFLVNDYLIDYKLAAEGTWKKYITASLQKQVTQESTHILKNLFDNNEGGFVAFGNKKLRLDGTRASYIYDKDYDGKVKQGERLDLKAQLLVNENNNIYGFYNNVDYSETMYGIRYKNTGQNNGIKEINLGDFRRDPGLTPFAENASVFGANTWLQAGKKTERFKRSKYSVKAMSGQLRSRKTFEYFQGALVKFQYSIRDVDFLKNLFFDIPGLQAGSGNPEHIEVFVDDKNSTNNTKNISRTIIAGISGDFEQLYATEDYAFFDKFRVLRLNKPVLPSHSLVVRYTLNGQVIEEIIQTGGIPSSKQNIYYLYGSGIIPNSMKIELRDTFGTTHNLANYGLDINSDNQPDPGNIDYSNGYLMFPSPNPFPANTYDSAAISSYRININFETKLQIIKLKHKDLVRGTETIMLDGITATQGIDYVLDYTNGTLTFVKEGVVNTDTRIEIEYEYYLEEDDEQVHGASMNFSPSDNFYMQADWLNFNKSPDSKLDTLSNLLSLHNEIRNDITSKTNVKLISGVAYQAEDNKVSGGYAEGLISTSKIRLQTKYETYDKSYTNLYTPQSIIGKTKNNLQFFSSADVLSYLKLTGEWKKTQAFDKNENNDPSNILGNYSILLHKNNLPSWQISYQDINTNSDSGKFSKFSINNLLEYQLPDFIIRYMLVKSLKLEANFKQGKQAGLELLGTDEHEFNHKYFRVNSSFTDQITGSFFYRRNDYFNDSAEDKSFLSRNERVLINFSQEEWRVLQLNFIMENTLEQNHLTNAGFYNSKINKYSQVNARFSPGQLWKRLNMLFFEFNINQTASSWGFSNKQNSSYLWQLYNKNQKLFDYTQLTTNYSAKNELRPNSNIILYSQLEWNKQNTKNSLSALDGYFKRWNEKLELKLSYNLRLILQYKQFYQDNHYMRIYKYYEPSSWLEHRWSTSLQDMINIQYRISTNQFDRIVYDSNNLLFTYNIIWRKDNFLHLDRLEIRNDITGNITNTAGDKKEKVQLYSTNTSLDIYPFASAILRFQLQYKQNDDYIIEENSTTGLAYNFRFIMKF